VEQQQITQEEADAFKNFINLNNVPTVNLYIYTKLGQLKHLEGDEGYEASKKVLKKLGLNDFHLSKTTAMPYEEQFWEQFDQVFGLSEEEMFQELPKFITDPTNQAKVQALLDNRIQEVVGQETTKHLA